MDDDPTLGELLAGALHEFEEMFLVGMHALVLQQAKEVELGIVLLPVGDEIRPLLALEEFAGAEAVVDALQFLDHDAPGAHIQVPDFGRTLVAIGQTHSLAAAV